MGHSVHTGSGGEALGERVHQLGINDSHTGNVVGVYADHLLLLGFVDDYVVDGRLGSSTGCGGQGDDWHGLLLGVGHAFERYHVGKFGVVAYNTDTLSGVHGTTATDSHDEIGLGSLEGFYTHLHVGHSGVGLYVVIHSVRNVGLVEHVEHHLGNAKLHQTLVCYYQCFGETQSGNYSRQLLASTGTEVRHFVKDKSTYHKCFC